MILPRHAFAALERWERAAIERAETEVFNSPDAADQFSDEATARGDLIYRLEQRAGSEWWTKITRFDLFLIEALGSEGIVAVEDHPVLARLRVAFAQHWAIVLRARERMEVGRWEWRDEEAPAPTQAVSSTAMTPAAALPSVADPITLEEALERYLHDADATNRMAQRSRSEIERVFRLFIEHIGPGVLAHTVLVKNVTDFRDALLKTPSRLSAADREIPFRQLVLRCGSAPPAKRKNVKTVAKYLDFLSAVFLHAAKRQSVASNPVAGAKFEADRKPRPPSRIEFTRRDLETIFWSPLFFGNRGLGRHHQSGDIILWGAPYWVMLLAVTTGARLNELGQLCVSDVRVDDEVPHLSINVEVVEGAPSAQAKTVKTRMSLRDLPIHPTLIRLGFLDYRAEMERRGEVFLFPELRRSTANAPTKEMSRWAGRYFDRVGIKDTRKVFHSFRHGVVVALGSRVPDYLRRHITGHSSGHVGDRYGSRPPLEAALKAICEIPLDFLDKLPRATNPIYEIDLLRQRLGKRKLVNTAATRPRGRAPRDRKVGTTQEGRS